MPRQHKGDIPAVENQEEAPMESGRINGMDHEMGHDVPTLCKSLPSLILGNCHFVMLLTRTTDYELLRIQADVCRESEAADS